MVFNSVPPGEARNSHKEDTTEELMLLSLDSVPGIAINTSCIISFKAHEHTVQEAAVSRRSDEETGRACLQSLAFP